MQKAEYITIRPKAARYEGLGPQSFGGCSEAEPEIAGTKAAYRFADAGPKIKIKNRTKYIQSNGEVIVSNLAQKLVNYL